MLQKVMIQPSAARRCALLSLHRTRCMHVCPVRGKGSRRQTRRRVRRCRGRSRSAAWKGGNGGILLLDVDFASFTFIPQTERQRRPRPGTDGFRGIFELSVQTVNKYILYYSRRLLPHSQASKHENRQGKCSDPLDLFHYLEVSAWVLFILHLCW